MFASAEEDRRGSPDLLTYRSITTFTGTTSIHKGIIMNGYNNNAPSLNQGTSKSRSTAKDKAQDDLNKSDRLTGDNMQAAFTLSSPVAMGPVKKVDQGQSDRNGDTTRESVDEIANANPLANRFKNTEGRGA